MFKGFTSLNFFCSRVSDPRGTTFDFEYLSEFELNSKKPCYELGVHMGSIYEKPERKSRLTFPLIKLCPRIGTRGNSKYHYYGIRVKANSALNHMELGSQPPRPPVAKKRIHKSGDPPPDQSIQVSRSRRVWLFFSLWYQCTDIMGSPNNTVEQMSVCEQNKLDFKKFVKKTLSKTQAPLRMVFTSA